MPVTYSKYFQHIEDENSNKKLYAIAISTAFFLGFAYLLEPIESKICFLTLSLVMTFVVKHLYKRAMARIASEYIKDIHGEEELPVPTIRDLQGLISQLREIRDKNEEIDEDGDVAYNNMMFQ